MFFDDLPIWGFVGKVEKMMHAGEVAHYKHYLFTHIHFDIHYNGGMSEKHAMLKSVLPHERGLEEERTRVQCGGEPSIAAVISRRAGDRVIEVNVSTDPYKSVDISADKTQVCTWLIC